MNMGERDSPRLVGGDKLIEEYYTKGHANVMEFAKFLNMVEPRRSIHAWRVAVNRWMKKNDKTVEDLQNIGEETTDDTWGLMDGYYYDSHNDLYLTYLKCAEGVVTIEGDTHRAMKSAYSESDDAPATSADISRDFGMPQGWVREYCRKHGWTHSMIPFTDEEVATRPIESMVNQVIADKRRSVAMKIENEKWKQIQKDAEKLRTLEYTLLSEFRELVAKSPKAGKIQRHNFQNTASDYALVISPTDLHWGKYGWVDEVGETYDFDEAKSRLFDKTQNLIQRLPGAPEKVIMATGSDWFHIDNREGSTTKGTPQDMCGSPAEIYMSGCELAREHIDLLRAVGPVEVVFMAGNHDRHSTLGLMMYLSAVYENVDDVEVIVSPHLRQYVTYGNTLLGFTHGDCVRNTNLPALMSVESRENWGKCAHHVWFHGHKHHRKLLEHNGAFIIQLPSLAGEDRYHSRMGFMSGAGLCAHFIDKKQGLIGSLYAPVTE